MYIHIYICIYRENCKETLCEYFLLLNLNQYVLSEKIKLCSHYILISSLFSSSNTILVTCLSVDETEYLVHYFLNFPFLTLSLPISYFIFLFIYWSGFYSRIFPTLLEITVNSYLHLITSYL